MAEIVARVGPESPTVVSTFSGVGGSCLGAPVLREILRTRTARVGVIGRTSRPTVPCWPPTATSAPRPRLDTGDISTLANPDVVRQIRVSVQGKEKVASKEGPEDPKQFGSGRVARVSGSARIRPGSHRLHGPPFSSRLVVVVTRSLGSALPAGPSGRTARNR